MLIRPDLEFLQEIADTYEHVVFGSLYLVLVSASILESEKWWVEGCAVTDWPYNYRLATLDAPQRSSATSYLVLQTFAPSSKQVAGIDRVLGK